MTVDLSALSSASNPADFVAELMRFPSSFVYRGQADSSYALVSSLRRRLASVAPPERRRIEQRIVSSFVNILGDRVDELEMLAPVLALMQHHGAPTRLIDFSTSPIVGVYVAVESLSASNGRIFVVDVEGMSTAWREEAIRLGKSAASYAVLSSPTFFLRAQEENLTLQVDESIPLPMPLVPARSSDRMRAQSGLFLAEPLSRDWGAKAADYVGSFEVPADWKLDLLRVCLQTNNGGGTLFPGLDGVGREILERELAGVHAPLLRQP